MYFGLVVFLIVLLIIYYTPWWTTEPGVSYLGNVAVSRNLKTGNVQYLNEATDADGCQKLCNDAEWCNAYTWQNNSATDQPCYGMTTPGTTASGGPYISGQKLNGFEPKLMHMFGMANAGESMVVNVPGKREGMEMINAPGKREGMEINVPGKREGMVINAPGKREGMMINVPGKREGMMINVPGKREGMIINAPGKREGMMINVPGKREGMMINVPGKREGMAMPKMKFPHMNIA